MHGLRSRSPQWRKNMAKLIQLCTEASRRDEDFSRVWPAAGMGYIFVGNSGKLIVVDGGESRQDAEQLLAHLERLSGGNRPTVDLWIISHAHLDHYGALEILSKDESLRERVTVKQMCFSQQIPVTFDPDDDRRLSEIPARLGCENTVPHAGDVLAVDDLTVKILFTWENYERLESAHTFNQLSLIFIVTCGTRRMMLVGDSSSTGPRWVRTHYSAEELKSDHLQLAHHGLDGGEVLFYKTVAPSVVWIPCSLGGAKFIKMPETVCNAHNRYIQDRALSVVCACMGTVEAEL